MVSPVTDTTIPLPRSELAQHFPEWVLPDERPGYHGDVVIPEHLAEIVRGLRDELGFNLLSSITAADYPQDNLLDVIYHFSKTDGGVPYEIKCRVTRDRPDRSFAYFHLPGRGIAGARSLGPVGHPLQWTS